MYSFDECVVKVKDIDAEAGDYLEKFGRHLDDCNPNICLTGKITWAQTPQGYAYWEHINFLFNAKGLPKEA